ncbi:hypothetical protein ACLOJK_019689 [Asimina triloba]
MIGNEKVGNEYLNLNSVAREMKIGRVREFEGTNCEIGSSVERVESGVVVQMREELGGGDMCMGVTESRAVCSSSLDDAVVVVLVESLGFPCC